MESVHLAVEMLGLPGAGKSSVSSRVVRILAERGHVVDDLSYWLACEPSRWIRAFRKGPHVAREVILHPFATARAIREIAAIRHPSLRVLGKMILNWLLVSALARRARKPGIHLYDQGIFQSFWSIGFGGGPDAVSDAAWRLWGTVPAPDLVVVIEANPPAILHRLRMRQEIKSRIDRLYESQPEVIERCAMLLDATMQVLEAIRTSHASMGMIVLRCEGSDGLDRESRRLASVIESLLTPPVPKGTTMVSQQP